MSHTQHTPHELLRPFSWSVKGRYLESWVLTNPDGSAGLEVTVDTTDQSWKVRMIDAPDSYTVEDGENGGVVAAERFVRRYLAADLVERTHGRCVRSLGLARCDGDALIGTDECGYHGNARAWKQHDAAVEKAITKLVGGANR